MSCQEACLIFCIKGEFLEKRDEQDEQLLIGPGEQLNKYCCDPTSLHLLFYLKNRYFSVIFAFWLAYNPAFHFGPDLLLYVNFFAVG